MSESLPSAEKGAGLPRLGRADTRREFGVIEDRTDKGLGYALLKTYRSMGDALADSAPPRFFVVHRMVTVTEWMHLGDIEDEGRVLPPEVGQP